MKFDQIENNIALERQIRLILSTFKNVTEGSNFFYFRCPICGDSKKSKLKKRCYILKSRIPYIIYCHNCFYNKTVIRWMKEFYPSYYKDYISEILQNKKENKPLPKIKSPVVKKYNEKEQTKFFIPIQKGITPLFAKAIKLCNDRKIPEEVWSKWFVATDGMYSNRLIIPFYDNNNKIYNYQGRSLYDYMTPKYLTRKGEHNCIYNYYLVDKNKPVICFEGIIDCLMIPNSIAICGANKEVDLSEFKEVYFLFDNDETGKKRSIRLIQEGKRVFLWNKFLKEFGIKVKDINELYIKTNRTFKFEELKNHFSNAIFDKVYLI